MKKTIALLLALLLTFTCAFALAGDDIDAKKK